MLQRFAAACASRRSLLCWSARVGGLDTALIESCALGPRRAPPLTRAFLSAGANPNSSFHFRTAPQEAALHGDAESLALLARHGADLNLPNAHGLSPLEATLWEPMAPEARLCSTRALLELGAAVDWPDSPAKWGAFEQALLRGRDSAAALIAELRELRALDPSPFRCPHQPDLRPPKIACAIFLGCPETALRLLAASTDQLWDHPASAICSLALACSPHPLMAKLLAAPLGALWGGRRLSSAHAQQALDWASCLGAETLALTRDRLSITRMDQPLPFALERWLDEPSLLEAQSWIEQRALLEISQQGSSGSASRRL